MLNFCDFIQVYVFSTNHHLKYTVTDHHRPKPDCVDGAVAVSFS